ncbi:MAG: paraslipin [Ornithinimicrobium sp.]|uniref:paraslipin n=1 Tax=Ornithinimicrobium sp. TaxID=1977084 RepID=UPI003D9BCB2A
MASTPVCTPGWLARHLDVVAVDSATHFQPTDPKAATYEVNDWRRAVERLTVTTLREVIGTLNLEQALSSRDALEAQLRLAVADASSRWGVRVLRVELTRIDPPH